MNSQKKKTAVFAGSFDPLTKGHESIILRAMPLFDEIHVMIGVNSQKPGMFSVEKRMEWIETTFKKYPKVKAACYKGLTVDYCRRVGASYILRGVRSTTDFQYEQNIARINQTLDVGIETIFMLTLTEDTPISSSAVRELLMFGGNVSKFVPSVIAQSIQDEKNTL